MSTTTVTVDEANNALVIERTFAAPKNRVWAAFTQAELFKQWYSPRGWTTTVKTFDFNVGGATLFGMTCEDESQGEFFGMTEWGKLFYTAIDAENSFSFENSFTDEHGTPTEGMPVSQVTTEFSETAEGTRVISRDTYPSLEALQAVVEMGAPEGLAETWEQLAELLD